MRLLLPRPRAVDIVGDLVIVRADLLGGEPFQGGAEGIPDSRSQQATLGASVAGRLQHRGTAPSGPAGGEAPARQDSDELNDAAGLRQPSFSDPARSGPAATPQRHRRRPSPTPLRTSGT